VRVQFYARRAWRRRPKTPDVVIPAGLSSVIHSVKRAPRGGAVRSRMAACGASRWVPDEPYGDILQSRYQVISRRCDERSTLEVGRLRPFALQHERNFKLAAQTAHHALPVDGKKRSFCDFMQCGL